jgi:UDP-N-acetylmuramoyl-L-alanine---L-glutamate ligase
VRFSQLKGRSIGVWGAGREVRSLADQLWRLPGAKITVLAFDTMPDPDVPAALNAPEARIATGPETVEALAECDVVVRSPGVSIYKPEVQALLAGGTPVTTATSLWLSEHGSDKVIGITGTKGKSTTAALASHLARAAGVKAALAGNIGVPALELLDNDPAPELVILELSSYQIADLASGPEIAVITNLYREHLDWHRTEEAYRREKLRIFELPGVRTAVVNARDPELAQAAASVESVLTYGEPAGWNCDGEGLTRAGELVVAPADLPLPGPHNALNLCAALTALEAAGVNSDLPRGLAGFSPLPHRLQVCGERDQVAWVDDSISTTPESTLAALAAFAGRDVVLLAGGQDRGQDYTELGVELARRGAAIVGMPTTGERAVAAARQAGVPAERAVAAADLTAAAGLAQTIAQPGSVILLSPAAPSYDHFRNFEERGERFRELSEAPPA